MIRTKMIRTTFYSLILFLFCTACSDPSTPNPEEKIEPEIEQLTVSNEDALSTRGSVLDGGRDEEPRFFMEAATLKMDADEANRTIDSLKRFCAQDTTNIDANFLLGTAWTISCNFNNDNNFEHCTEAIPLLNRVVQEKPNYKNGAAYFNRAQAYVISKQWDKAQADINKYLEIDAELPSMYAYYLLASIAYAKGDTTETCKCIKTVKEGVTGFGMSSLDIWDKRCK